MGVLKGGCEGWWGWGRVNGGSEEGVNGNEWGSWGGNGGEGLWGGLGVEWGSWGVWCELWGAGGAFGEIGVSRGLGGLLGGSLWLWDGVRGPWGSQGFLGWGCGG